MKLIDSTPIRVESVVEGGQADRLGIIPGDRIFKMVEKREVSDDRDFYKILNLSRHATADDIKKSYRKSALEHHPDRHESTSSTDDKTSSLKTFLDVKAAYEVLSDPKLKESYDMETDMRDVDEATDAITYDSFMATLVGGRGARFKITFIRSVDKLKVPPKKNDTTYTVVFGKETPAGMTLEEEVLSDSNSSSTHTHVKSITKGGQAERQGVGVGDRIFKIQGREAISHDNLIAKLRERGERTAVTFLRGEARSKKKNWHDNPLATAPMMFPFFLPL
ncbi:hypothetical protein TrST_g11513 [Triparma strigata]|uniref:J domain-containing protein n=1 Tax=Triparma strigata TaxID=1606541 RepID=A0A9W7DX02_9STRA|nr:hypothetical protein TrST_g11513 [Triparma strigata]